MTVIRYIRYGVKKGINILYIYLFVYGVMTAYCFCNKIYKIWR